MLYGMIPILIAASLIFGAAAGPGAGSSAETVLADFDSFMLMRVNPQGLTTVSVDQAADALKDYDVIFVGEFHDHIANHLAEMVLLRTIHERAPQIALSMEQFERDQQTTVDDYLAGKIGEDTLTSSLAWKNYVEAYRPLVEYAKDHHLPMIAANAPQNIVHCIAREGAEYLATLPTDTRKLIAADLHTQGGAYKEKFLKFMDEDSAHGELSDSNKKTRDEWIEKSFAAQVARDDTMAESIASFLKAHPGYKVLHVTGVFHVAERLGTLERLRMRMPSLKIALVLPLSVDPANPIAVNPSDAKGADFDMLLQREPEAYVTDAERKAADASEAAKFGAAQDSGCKH